MNLIKWNNNVDDSFRSFPSLMDEFFNRDIWGRNWSRGVSIPAVNIKEGDTSFSITLAVPGLQKEDCKIKVEDGILTISSEKKGEKKEKEGSYSRYEYNFSSFSRSFVLPENADPENIKAKCEHGELKVELGKKEERISLVKEIHVE